MWVAFGAGVGYAVGEGFTSRVGPSAWTLALVLGGLSALLGLIGARRTVCASDPAMKGLNNTPARADSIVRDPGS